MGQKWLYFYGVREQLEDYGCLIHVTEVNPIAGVESRGRELADQIVEYLEQHKDVSRVNLIGHSMGGLDARVAAHLLKNNEIASITTISSPHHGSELALIGGPSEKVRPLINYYRPLLVSFQKCQMKRSLWSTFFKQLALTFKVLWI